MYGGSTTSILVRVPGESASVITCLDGHEMARQGRAGVALAIAAIGSFVAGTAGVVGLMLLAPLLVKFALAFGPTEYFALIVLGLTFAGSLSGGSVLKSQVMIIIGLLLSIVGIDSFSTSLRFTFGIVELWSGFEIVPLVIGLFAIAEVLRSVETKEDESVITGKVRNLWPSRADLKQSAAPIARGTFIGFILGVLPGAGATLSSFVSYGVERRFAREPDRFGKGAIEGVAGPESANNAATSSALIPLLTLGLPSNAVMALMMMALLIHGLQPGPRFITEQSGMFWTFIASMYVGNVMLLILNLPLVGLWARLLSIPGVVLMALVLVLCIIGAYVVNNSAFDLRILILFGLFGYVAERAGFPLAPLVLAFVLGKQLEFTLRQALVLADGNVMVMVWSRPLAASLLLVAGLLIAAQVGTWAYQAARHTSRSASPSEA
jgi:putative tricarboxylic transport membrane protein